MSMRASDHRLITRSRPLQRHGIDCGYAVPGIIMAAHTEKALRAHEKRVDYWQARGRPLAYVRGLARAAIKAGAALHEGTRAIRLAPRSGSTAARA